MARPRLHFAFLGALAVLAGGCGGGQTLDTGGPGAAKGQPRASAPPAPRRAPASAAGVIRGWADALRGGDVQRAAGFFAIPSTVQNGTPLVRLDSRAAVRGFNLSLPCGARVLRTAKLRSYTVAEFALVERRGPGGGQCGSGVGSRASTAFLVRDGKIVQWRRVSQFPGGKDGDPAPAAPAHAPEI